ncbi:hypothetical protein PR003_g9305 [Phytophthora rubi]|uniref:Uncharacterized protein n=1 Tax=Phytophthora rubi TaxID=129364 RepID=A0A6A4F8U9_9STRA|nr:hypothetical protein PR002_g9191 [Phytophthora rubi]KAE9035670.1 hypothetical protein PR001_g9213 [Phytophthora rubi]KAE9342759.1 hypothetical protein PR003_g9305 [Phytophthora rubi]
MEFSHPRRRARARACWPRAVITSPLSARCAAHGTTRLQAWDRPTQDTRWPRLDSALTGFCSN